MDSSRRRLDNIFKWLADIALHVPPPELILAMLNADKQKIKDFLPTTRFTRAVEAVTDGKAPLHVPNCAGDPDTFYRGLFDSVARRCAWPSSAETDSLWLRTFQGRKRSRGRISESPRVPEIEEHRWERGNMGMKDRNDATVLPEGSFEALLELVQTELAERAEGDPGASPSQKLLGAGVGELLAIQLVFPLIVSVAGAAFYDVLKHQFCRWRERQRDRSSFRVPAGPEESYRSADEQLQESLLSLGFDETEVERLQERIRTSLEQTRTASAQSKAESGSERSTKDSPSA